MPAGASTSPPVIESKSIPPTHAKPHRLSEGCAVGRAGIHPMVHGQRRPNGSNRRVAWSGGQLGDVTVVSARSHMASTSTRSTFAGDVFVGADRLAAVCP